MAVRSRAGKRFWQVRERREVRDGVTAFVPAFVALFYHPTNTTSSRASSSAATAARSHVVRELDMHAPSPRRDGGPVRGKRALGLVK